MAEPDGGYPAVRHGRLSARLLVGGLGLDFKGLERGRRDAEPGCHDRPPGCARTRSPPHWPRSASRLPPRGSARGRGASGFPSLAGPVAASDQRSLLQDHQADSGSPRCYRRRSKAISLRRAHETYLHLPRFLVNWTLGHFVYVRCCRR